MNTLLMTSLGLQSLVDAPVWVLLLKTTAILSVGWLAHLTLARANPRWRVLLWRVTAVSLITLPAIAWLLPALEIPLHQPPAIGEAAAVPIASSASQTDRIVAENVPIGLPGTPLDTNVAFRPQEIAAEPPHAAGSIAFPRAQGLSPADPKPFRVNWPILLPGVWLAGLAILAFRLCIGHYRVWRVVRRARQPMQRIRSECNRVARAIGSRGPVEVLQSTDVQSPFLCGLWRPRLLLPAPICEASYRRELPGIMAHELTHARSHDVAWNLGLQLISILLWFHPLVWRIRKAHLVACELVCDAVSASFVGDVTEYCRILARVAVDGLVPQITIDGP